MVEHVQTGGLVSFRREKGDKLEASAEEKKDIEDAYKKYYERKKKEKRNRIICWIIAILALILIIGVFVYIKN